MIRQPVQITAKRGVQPLDRDHAAFGAAHDHAGHMSARRGLRATGEDEAGEGRQGRVHRLDLGFQAGHRHVRQPQPVAAPAGDTQIGAQIEQIVLNA